VRRGDHVTVRLALPDGDPAAPARLDAALGLLLDACETLATELQPFLPDAVGRIEETLRRCDPALGRRLFPKVSAVVRRPST
jgi:hypothetical protein